MYAERVGELQKKKLAKLEQLRETLENDPQLTFSPAIRAAKRVPTEYLYVLCVIGWSTSLSLLSLLVLPLASCDARCGMYVAFLLSCGADEGRRL